MGIVKNISSYLKFLLIVPVTFALIGCSMGGGSEGTGSVDIRGRVLNSQSGTAVAFAKVKSAGTGAEVITDADGNFKELNTIAGDLLTVTDSSGNKADGIIEDPNANFKILAADFDEETLTISDEEQEQSTEEDPLIEDSNVSDEQDFVAKTGGESVAKENSYYFEAFTAQLAVSYQTEFEQDLEENRVVVSITDGKNTLPLSLGINDEPVSYRLKVESRNLMVTVKFQDGRTIASFTVKVRRYQENLIQITKDILGRVTFKNSKANQDDRLDSDRESSSLDQSFEHVSEDSSEVSDSDRRR